MTDQPRTAAYGEEMVWKPQSPRFRPLSLVVSWFVAAVAVIVAATILLGLTVRNFGEAAIDAATIVALNAILPPVAAALRLPFTLALGFVLVLVLDTLILMLASHIDSTSIKVHSFGWRGRGSYLGADRNGGAFMACR